MCRLFTKYPGRFFNARRIGDLGFGVVGLSMSAGCRIFSVCSSSLSAWVFSIYDEAGS